MLSYKMEAHTEQEEYFQKGYNLFLKYYQNCLIFSFKNTKPRYQKVEILFEDHDQAWDNTCELALGKANEFLLILELSCKGKVPVYTAIKLLKAHQIRLVS